MCNYVNKPIFLFSAWIHTLSPTFPKSGRRRKKEGVATMAPACGAAKHQREEFNQDQLNKEGDLDIEFVPYLRVTRGSVHTVTTRWYGKPPAILPPDA